MSSASRITRPPVVVPPLQNGDHLTVSEFERRYKAMPEVKKAELIEGVVYMGSPVAVEYHGSPHLFDERVVVLLSSLHPRNASC